jgi:hypothetical protein
MLVSRELTPVFLAGLCRLLPLSGTTTVLSATFEESPLVTICVNDFHEEGRFIDDKESSSSVSEFRGDAITFPFSKIRPRSVSGDGSSHSPSSREMTSALLNTS